MRNKAVTLLLCMSMGAGVLSGCAQSDSGSTARSENTDTGSTESAQSTESASTESSEAAEVADEQTKEEIENALNLANNEDQEWTYDSGADAWVLSITPYCTNQQLPDQQGCSVAVPGAYVTGIDTDGDGTADVTEEDGTDAVKGSLVIDYDAQVTSENGQVYTAATAPIILNTGAAGGV